MVANRNALKAYAPQARKDFIQAMTNRAAQFGITKAGNAPGEERGELLIISGKAFPRSVAEQRRRDLRRVGEFDDRERIERVDRILSAHAQRQHELELQIQIRDTAHLRRLNLDAGQRADLEAFLRSLSR